MDIRFVAPEMDALDALKCEAILATFFSDDRPLSGVLGLIDWRLCGFVSRSIVQGQITGAFGETSLVPLRPRLGVDKLFLLGLGASDEFADARLSEATARMLDVVARAKVRTAALVLPGRSTERIAPAVAMESFVSASLASGGQDELILIETVEARRDMEPIVQRERRRARVAGT
jgi:Cytosol aminopeptidase family, N-terminal domain